MRPTWNEYFFEAVHAIAKRASCDRGHSGCVIVKDNQILVTGYVGAPPGFDHCDEVGHEMEERVRYIEPGIVIFNPTMSEPSGYTFNENLRRFEMPKSQHCIRTLHAEENAILQAARQGIALLGASMYCTMTPCRTCAMKIVRVGIVKVYAEFKYHAGNASEEIFKRAGIELYHKNGEVVSYPSQA